MKKMIAICFTSLLAIQAQAIRLPNSGQILRGGQKILPVSPHSVQCERTREDAHKHIQSHNQTISANQAEIEEVDKTITRSTTTLARLNQEMKTLELQNGVLSKFQKVTFEIHQDIQSVKTGLVTLHDQARDPVLRETLSSMQSQKESQSFARLAGIVEELLQKNADELELLLNDSKSEVLLSQMIELIAASQEFVSQYRASLERTIEEQKQTIEENSARQKILNDQIASAQSNIAIQNQRTACNF